jgi:hypothetical protein
MLGLLRLVDTGNALKPQSRALLLDMMYRCKTGSNRIRGILPAGARVENKTGTLSGYTGDVGYLTFPSGGGSRRLLRPGRREPARRHRHGRAHDLRRVRSRNVGGTCGDLLGAPRGLRSSRHRIRAGPCPHQLSTFCRGASAAAFQCR